MRRLGAAALLTFGLVDLLIVCTFVVQGDWWLAAWGVALAVAMLTMAKVLARG